MRCQLKEVQVHKHLGVTSCAVAVAVAILAVAAATAFFALLYSGAKSSFCVAIADAGVSWHGVRNLDICESNAASHMARAQH